MPLPSIDAAVPVSLSQRLEALGLTVLAARADGHAQVVHGESWLARLLVKAPPFRGALRDAWDALAEAPGELTTLWPGLWVVALPARRKRRPTLAAESAPLSLVLLTGHELLGADQFRAACDAAKLDYQATVARVRPDQLVTPTEATRLTQALVWMHQDATQLDRRVDELQTLSTALSDCYEELSLLYRLSGNMVVNQPPEEFLTNACHELRQVVDVRWMALLLIDEPRLESLRGKLFHTGTVRVEPEALARFGGELVTRFQDRAEPAVIDDTADLDIAGLDQLSSDLLVVPLRSEKQMLGVLFGGDKVDRTRLSTVDTKLCDSLASSLAIFLENRMLYDDMQAMFMGTLHALTSAIDAKDSYTHGHSERVALMSHKLAEACGLDEHTCGRIYVAGLVHDVGKIGVPEHVLCKPGKLTDEEFALIKMHPEIGGRILQDIRQMRDLLPGVLHHHERWDGRGYPHRLAGRDIPLFGRLIGLADAFDAMSSDRTYRKAMHLDQVLEEVRRCAGTQFDPELADVFVTLDFEPFFELIHKHEHYQPAPAAQQ